MVPVPRVNSPFYSYCISFKEVTQNNQASRLVPPFYIDIFFIYNNQICMCEMKSLSRARLFAMPWTVACTKLLRPWDFLGKSTGVCCCFLLQGIFPTQGSNPGLPHCRQTLYRLSYQGSPFITVRSSIITNVPR